MTRGSGKAQGPLGGYNPFYLGLIGLSVAFVMTILAYLMAGLTSTEPDEPASGLSVPGTRIPPLAALLNDHAPTLLGILLAAMFVMGLLAMLTDSFFRPGSQKHAS